MDNVSLNTDEIRNWRSIITLIVFVLTNINVLFPFHIPILVPRGAWYLFIDALSYIRIIPPRRRPLGTDEDADCDNGKLKPFVRFNFPMNFITAPLIADLFLLAILAIGRKEVHDGTVGTDNIAPIDIMVFFITLAYIAISIDASGLIRFAAFKVLQLGGKVGHRLFFFLYSFFFLVGSFIGNDPIILSGTAFLAYLTRVSSNIAQPRAWIYTQFAIANIASAILVSSNPTNLVLAGAFSIRFINYTANMIVPVVVTAIVLFPILLYIIFADESLIPSSIKMHDLPPDILAKKPVNPNIPNARGRLDEEGNNSENDEQANFASLEEIMNPFLDKGGAVFGALIMAVTLITVLVINAVSNSTEANPVFWVTLPAAFVMFCWDLGFGWYNREETRQIARQGREDLELARVERAQREAENGTKSARTPQNQEAVGGSQMEETKRQAAAHEISAHETADQNSQAASPTDILASKDTDGNTPVESEKPAKSSSSLPMQTHDEKKMQAPPQNEKTEGQLDPTPRGTGLFTSSSLSEDLNDQEQGPSFQSQTDRRTLVSIGRDFFRWSQETFPTATTVAVHLPFPLVPFALCMFVLVQALATKGWIPVFAYGWNHWVRRTGTVGAIGGMGFLSVVLCNFAGTNIGTTILLSRVVQTWQVINKDEGTEISDRTFWATVYSMAIGLNYGAFSTAFSASLAGMLWRDILSRKNIHVGALEFARVNLPIITVSMIVGCAVLTGQVYIVRTDQPYN